MIDIVEFETKLRAEVAEVTAKGLAQIGLDPKAEADFIKAQAEFNEAAIQGHLAFVRGINAGYDSKSLAAAAGVFVGNIAASVEGSFTNEAVRAFYEHAAQTVEDGTTKKGFIPGEGIFSQGVVVGKDHKVEAI
jgi:hypothetical protein